MWCRYGNSGLHYETKAVFEDHYEERYITTLFRLVQVHQKVEDHYEERREESKTCGDQEK